MRMRPQGIFALASTVTSALFNVTAAVAPQWIHDHMKPYVIPLWVLTLGLWCWFLYERDREKAATPEHAPHSPPSANTNTNINTVSPVFNLGYGATVLPGPKSSSNEEMLPKLNFLRCHPQIIRSDKFNHEGDMQDHRMLLLAVENVLPELHRPYRDAHRLSTTLEFYLGDASIAKISRAHWHNEANSQLDIYVGKQAQIVLGELRGEFWVCFDNTLPPGLNPEEAALWAFSPQSIRQVKVPFLRYDGIIVDVIGFSNELKRVLLKGRFKITRYTDVVAGVQEIVR